MGPGLDLFPIDDLLRRRETRKEADRFPEPPFQAKSDHASYGRDPDAACEKHGPVPDLLVHDLRRVAVKRLLSAGLSTTLCKRFTGHESDSVFDRYALIDLAQLQEAGEQYAAYLRENRAEPERKVVGLSGTSTAQSTVETACEVV
jgi:hypothetical protein